MKSETYKFRVTSTAQHKELFATRKEAEKWIKELQKTEQVEPFVEFRIFEVIEE